MPPARSAPAAFSFSLGQRQFAPHCSGQQALPRQIDVPRAHSQDQIPRLSQLSQPLGDLLQGGAELRTRDALGQIPGGNPQSIRLPGGEDLRQKHLVRQLEHLDELVKQLLRSGVGVGLEGTDHPPVSQAPGRGQQGLQFAGVMRVVVIHRRAVELPLVLKPAACSMEVPKAVPDGGEGHPKLEGSTGGGQSVAYIVDAGDTELNAPQLLPSDDQVKGGEPTLPGQSSAVDVPLLQAEGEHGAAPIPAGRP